MGKRIVINTYGSAGDLNPFFVVARGLQARGHRVVIATDDFSRAAVESAGLEFYLARRSFLYGNEDSSDRSAFNIHNSYDDLIAAVRRADLLITHQIAFAAPLVAARVCIPWVSVVLSPFTFASAYEPLTLMTSPRSRPFTPMVYNLYLSQLSQMKQSGQLYTKQAERLRGQLGLAPGRNILFEDNHSPHLVLALFSSTFAAPQPDWPPQTRVTGFVFDAHLTDGAGLSPGLKQFLDAGSPPLVFTLGSASIFDTGSFCAASVGAAKLLGQRAVLLGSGASSYMFPNGPNLISVEYAPHGELFSRAAAVIHHGGIGTTAATMRAGSPMLVLPGYGWDQPDNAARATGLGVARMLAQNEYNALSAATELARLLSDSSYTKKAAELKCLIQAEDGAGAACDEIERYLSSIN
jgi:rhamnosyltransferase subunit B